MKLLEQIERINRLHELIKHRRTGTPSQLARSLNLSTSMIYKLMDELKLREAPIAYSRQLGTYYYSRRFQMKISIDFKSLGDDEEQNYSGGTCFQNILEKDSNYSPAPVFLY
jgi:predicted DNA-binding transcriptional regulator YafY